MLASGELRLYLVWSFAAAGTLWALLSGLLLLNRLWHDHRRRRLEEITSRIESSGVAVLSLKAPTPEIRRILRTLSRRAIYRMIERPSTSDAVAAACAAFAVERWGPEQMIRDASEHDRRTKWRRLAALLALAHLRDPNAYRLLAVALEGHDRDLAGAAVLGLVRLGDHRAATILIDALRKRLYSPSRIATHLERFPVPVAHLLRPLLSDPEPQTRYWAASILGSGATDPSLLSDIVVLTGDRDASVRKVAVEALALLTDPRIPEVVLALLVDPAPFVRSAAIRALALAARALPEEAQAGVVRAIAARLADDFWEVRNAAKEALVGLGPPVWTAVAQQLDSTDAFARNGAAEVLQNIGLLDQLIATVAHGNAPDPTLTQVLGRAFEEGGPMMIDAAVARTGQERLPQVVSLLASIGLRPAT